MVNTISPIGAQAGATQAYVANENSSIQPENAIFKPGKVQATFMGYENNKDEQIKQNIQNDLQSGVLTRESKLDRFLDAITQSRGGAEAKAVFHPDVYSAQNNGKELTIGEIKARYGIPDGVLMNYNDDFGKDVNNANIKWGNLDKNTPSALEMQVVKFPESIINEKLGDIPSA